MDSRALPAVVSAVAVMAAGATALFFAVGPISAHMLLHIAFMNVLAPLTACVLAQRWQPPDRISFIWGATTVQILMLWLWHVPSMHNAASTSVWISLAMHGSLFAAALVFWISLLTVSARQSWQAIFALLLTGKLACLLGFLLIFSPRLLYEAGHSHGPVTVNPLDDQHIAGLYMITACPLSFVLAGVIIAAQTISKFSRHISPLTKYIE